MVAQAYRTLLQLVIDKREDKNSTSGVTEAEGVMGAVAATAARLGRARIL